MVQMTHKHRRPHGTVPHPIKKCNIAASVCIKIENIGLYLNPETHKNWEYWVVPKSRNGWRGLKQTIVWLIHFTISSSIGDPCSVLPNSLIADRIKSHPHSRRTLPRWRLWSHHQLTLQKRGGGAYSQYRGGRGENTQQSSRPSLKSKQMEDVPQLQRCRITITWLWRWNREGDWEISQLLSNEREGYGRDVANDSRP
jgi:hypothetical protein